MLRGPVLRQIRFASGIAARDVAKAYAAENKQLQVHALLMDQTSWKSLVALEDVRPMMEIFSGLASIQNSITSPSVLATVTALGRTAKDCPVLLRSLLEAVRTKYQAEVHLELGQHCDTVAEAILQEKVPHTTKIIGTLINAYEIIDPAKGAAFYMEGNFVESGGSVIPCLVKSSAPIGIIEKVYRSIPRKGGRVRANMAWAYLIHGQVDKALEIRSQIRDATLSVERFLLGAFVGDAPLEVALESFASTTIPPHHASMTRLVNKAWAANHSTSQQLELLDRFLQLSQGNKEASFKPVTYAVTQNIVNQRNNSREQLVEDIKGLINVYSRYPSNSLFLNILLTHVSKHWGKEEELIMPILKAYGADTTSPVTYRVRLNSLARIHPTDKEAYIRQLWSARNQLPQKIDTYDWVALCKADSDLARSIYNETEQKDESQETRDALKL